MKNTLPEKSKSHEARISQITQAIIQSGQDKICFVILFGSFARGDWVFDRKVQDGIMYEYASDYDFLVITKTGKQAGSSSAFDLERKIKKAIESSTNVKDNHQSHIIIESLKKVNDDLEKSQYFFSDIKNEGVLLYDSKEFELSQPKNLNSQQRKQIAKADFDHWFMKSVEFIDNFKFNFDKGSYNNAAFQLHQATENLYSCILLSLGGYKPKSHDLKELGKLCASHSNEFLTIFPLANNYQNECFKLLQNAYIDARYSKNYNISKDQLEYLIARVEILKDLVARICESKLI